MSKDSLEEKYLKEFRKRILEQDQRLDDAMHKAIMDRSGMGKYDGILKLINEDGSTER